MSDQVFLRGLEVFAPIGVYEHEHGIEQKLLFDVVVDFDIAAAGASDALEDTIDYDKIANICRETARGQHHQLIETVATKISARILDTMKVDAVEVEVRKPGAVPGAETVAVRIRRARPS